MVATVAKADLPEPSRKLVELMQTINYGRIERLPIRDARPILNPRPAIVHEHKFGGENGPRPELAIRDFLLKEEVIQLFAFFDQFQDGVIDVLEVRRGLPFRVIVKEEAA
jgi:hypothetical protein